MGFFYFDESVHPKAEFAVGAFVYAEFSLDKLVTEAITESGLIPLVDEFKSGSRMDLNPSQAKLRDRLKEIVHNSTRIGLSVTPDSPRNQIGPEAIKCLVKILSTNQFDTGEHEAFVDQGLFNDSESRENRQVAVGGSECHMNFEQDSRKVPGIQVADLVAHTAAMMLLAQMGLLRKMVKAGENSGYDPQSELELEFELWASLRYSFFAAAPPPVSTWKSQLDFCVDVQSRGLHIADSCEPLLKKAALDRFGSMYLGCIH